jgi:transposase InsO family protein
VLQRLVEPGQFRARKVHRALAHHGMVGSMGQVGSAGDNAAMESFFALVQKNVLNRRRSWPTRDLRRQKALGRLTPIEYETIMTPQTAAAA